MATKEDLIRQAMINAEDYGIGYYSVRGAPWEPCVYWVVGDRIIRYLTEDDYFDAGMLTEDMMDELIIEER